MADALMIVGAVLFLAVAIWLNTHPSRRAACQRFGCGRDWPEMETCWRCGRHIPLDEKETK